MGFRRKRKAIESHVLRGDIPGVADPVGDVQPRDVPHVQAEMSRAARLLGGGRSLGVKAADQTYRDFGIPVFDRNTGRQQLADMLERGRNKQ